MLSVGQTVYCHYWVDFANQFVVEAVIKEILNDGESLLLFSDGFTEQFDRLLQRTIDSVWLDREQAEQILQRVIDYRKSHA